MYGFSFYNLLEKLIEGIIVIKYGFSFYNLLEKLIEGIIVIKVVESN